MGYVFISEKTFENARKAIRNARGKGRIVFSSSDDDLNRKILEKEEIDVLLLSLRGRKDRLKQRNSGFNQVMAKFAKKRNIKIGIDLDEILNADKEEKAELLARIRQNIRLCNKNKLDMVFFSFREKDKKNSRDLKALGLSLGMPTKMTKNL